MGVRGFLSYIRDPKNCLLEPYDLKNTHVVIDGLNILHALFNESIVVKPGSAGEKINKGQSILHGEFFGGDYDSFQNYVTKFFKNLQDCNVTPIVIFDGISRVKDREEALRKVFDDMIKVTKKKKRCPSPLFIWDVFNTVLRKLKIKFFKVPLEVDDTIAAVAKILDCPVISNDTDFCFYDVKFIIGSSFSECAQESNCNRALPCKIYHARRLIEKFDICNSSLLAIGLMLLRKLEYKSDMVFHLKDDIERFLESLLQMPFDSQRSALINDEHRKIEVTLKWLSHFKSSDEVLEGVLRRIPPDHRQKFRKLTEAFLQDFTSPSMSIMDRLGLEVEDERIPMDEATTENEDMEVLAERDLFSLFPEWFMAEMMDNKISRCSIDVVMKSYFVLWPFVDDKSYPATHEMSLPIVTSLISLLMSNGRNDEKSTVTVEMITMKDRRLIREREIVPKYPVSLQDLRKLDLSQRKEIIDEVLRIHGGFEASGGELDCLPDEWKLYINAAIFWMKQKTLPKRNRVHLSCLLFSMLFGIIDKEIGFLRDEASFREKFPAHRRKEGGNLKWRRSPEDESVKDALRYVSEDDCIAAAPFFIRNFMYEVVCRTPRNAWTIAHIFGQFQYVLLHLSVLNDLLGLPYAPPPIGDLFNGTLIYNLYQHFSQTSNVNREMEFVLASAPSLLAIFRGLLKVVSRYLPEEFRG